MLRQLADAPVGDVPIFSRAYARVVAAQIQATPAPACTQRELRAQMRALVRKVGLSPRKVNAIVARPERTYPYARLVAMNTTKQIADMALLAADRGIADAADASPVNLSLLPEAEMKAGLSRTPANQRTAFLIQRIARFTRITPREGYYVEALVQQGPAAVPAIAAQLERMRKERADYHRMAYSALLEAVARIGGDAARECVAQWRDDPERYVRGHAEKHYRALDDGASW
ncbi:MAG: hypothetical protein HY321_21485 [Armatimonadetes bacterium]|nr:hypothetical protein [Armatimonadota bacterium]